MCWPLLSLLVFRAPVTTIHSCRVLILLDNFTVDLSDNAEKKTQTNLQGNNTAEDSAQS